ncbi:MAG: hypothetical protein ACRDVK_10860 [Acidimicrobiia bacterium]
MRVEPSQPRRGQTQIKWAHAEAGLAPQQPDHRCQSLDGGDAVGADHDVDLGEPDLSNHPDRRRDLFGRTGNLPFADTGGFIQRQLGHVSLATTAIYLNHIAPKQVIETMRKREWTP